MNIRQLQLKSFLTLALGVQQEQGVPTSPGELISFFDKF
jgi:hypothetical protein